MRIQKSSRKANLGQYKQDRQCKYKRNIEAPSCNHFCSGKSIRITYSKLVFMGLFIQHAMRMRRIVALRLPLPTIFFPPRYLINGTIFEKEFIGNKMCAFSFSKKNLPGNCFSLKIIVRDMMENVYIGLYVKYTLFLSDLNENWIFTTNFQKKWYSNIKFHENPSSGSRVVPYRRAGRHDEADSRFSQFYKTA